MRREKEIEPGRGREIERERGPCIKAAKALAEKSEQNEQGHVTGKMTSITPLPRES